MRLQYQNRLFIVAIILMALLMAAGQIANIALARSSTMDALVRNNQERMYHLLDIYQKVTNAASVQMDEIVKNDSINYDITRLDDFSLGSGNIKDIEEQCTDLVNRLREYLSIMDVYVVTSQRILKITLEDNKVSSQLYAMEYGSFFNIVDGEDFTKEYNVLAEEELELTASDARGAIIRRMSREGTFVVGIVPVERMLSGYDGHMAVYSSDGRLKALMNMDISPYTMIGETLSQGEGYREILYQGKKSMLINCEDPQTGDICIGHLDHSGYVMALNRIFWQSALAAFLIFLLSAYMYNRWAKGLIAPLDMFRNIMDTSFDVNDLKHVDVQEYFPAGGYNLRTRLYGYFLSIIVPLVLSLLISFVLVALQGAKREKTHHQGMLELQVFRAEMALESGAQIAYRLANDYDIGYLLDSNTNEQGRTTLGNYEKRAVSHILMSKPYISRSLSFIGITDDEGRLLYQSKEQEVNLEQMDVDVIPSLQIIGDGNLLLNQRVNQLFATSGQNNTTDNVIGFLQVLFSGILFEDIVALEGTEMYLLDKEGAGIALHQMEHDDQRLRTIRDRAQNEGSQFDIYEDGQRFAVKLIDMKQAGWQALFVSPFVRDVPFVGDKVWAYLLLLAAFFMTALLSGIWATEAIIRPVRRLRSAIAVDDVKARIDETLFGRNEFRILAQRYNKMMDRLNAYAISLHKEERQRHELENRRREAEIIALQTQINPHFLYNIFTSIAVLIRSGRTEEAAQMVMDTGNLMRLGVYRGSLLVELREELDHVEHYMKLQRIRYLNRVMLHVDCLDELKDQKVVKFILQPVVENAIEHGLEDEESLLNIYIQVSVSDSTLVIEVDDDGVGIDDYALRERQKMLDNFRRVSQLGLSNVNERIRLNCGKDYGLELKASQRGGLKVILRLPDSN